MVNIKNGKTLKEIKELTEQYAKEHFGKEQILFEPIFRKEEDKYYLGFLVVEFADESKEDYRFKRPTKWMLVDIITGDFIKMCDAKDGDYTTLSKDELFDNNGSSSLFDYSNFVLSSYFNWKNKVIKDLNDKKSKDEDIDDKFLRVDGENISQSDFVIANIEPVLSDLHQEIMNRLGDEVGKAYMEYFEYIFDAIRNNYVETNELDQELLSQYLDLLKYSWPDCIQIINSFDNVLAKGNMKLESKLIARANEIKNRKLMNK